MRPSHWSAIGRKTAPMPVLIIIIAAFITALVSGVFGMAGGLLLLGVLAAYLPAAQAMALHGMIQAASNGSRAALLARHIVWPIMGFYLIGTACAAAILVFVAFQTSKAQLFLLLGAVPLVVWIPKERLHLDATRPLHAALCGFAITGLNVVAGVAGPLLDVFFVRATLGRHEVVATKAATQVVSHSIKIVYYGAPLVLGVTGVASDAARDLGLLFVLALPFTFAGTWAGGRFLKRFSDAGFRTWTRRIVTVIGVVYMVRGVMLLTA